MLSEKSIKNIIGVPLFESKKLACSLTDNKLKFVWVNKAFCDISGYSRDELVGNSIAVILDKKIFKAAWDEFTNYLKFGTHRKERWFCFTKAGERIDASIDVSRVTIEGKTYSLTIALDVTKESELEASLLKTRELLELTEQISKNGSFEFNIKTGETIWTPGMYSIWELHPDKGPATEELNRKLFSETDVNNLLSAFKDSIDSKLPVRVDTTLNFPDGRSKNLQTIAVSNKNDDDWIIGTVHDITEQHEAQKKITESEVRFRTLMESLPSIIWSSDNEGHIKYMNEYGLEYFGCTSDEIRDQMWTHYIHPDEKEHTDSTWHNTRPDRVRLNKTNRFKNHRGKYHHFQILLIPNDDTDGNSNGWIGIATNIQQRVVIEDELRISNSRLRSLINASPVPIYSIDTKGVVQDFWNPAAEELLGWKREDVIGRFLPHITDKDRPDFLKMVQNTVTQGKLTRTIVRSGKDGDEMIIDVTGGCIYNEEGEVTEILVTLMDMTEIETNRIHIQNSLHEKETLLQEIHHRVKNNLAIVVSLLQLQVLRSQDENVKLRLIEAQNRIYSIAMVHELLYQSEEFNNVDLTTYYDKLISSIKSNMQIGDSHVVHKLDIDKVSLNINQAIPLGLLINELVTNSFKYAFNENTEKGLISLSIREKKGIIEVEYSDSGPGFELSDEDTDSGLGMRIINSLITQLNAEHTMKKDGEFRMKLKFGEKTRGSASNNDY